MIKIRYAGLADGLHAQVGRCARQTVIHLAPGLSAPQRREALGRLIRTSRRAFGLILAGSVLPTRAPATGLTAPADPAPPGEPDRPARAPAAR